MRRTFKFELVARRTEEDSGAGLAAGGAHAASRIRGAGGLGLGDKGILVPHFLFQY